MLFKNFHYCIFWIKSVGLFKPQKIILLGIEVETWVWPIYRKCIWLECKHDTVITVSIKIFIKEAKVSYTIDF
jgi:hypothetical protein